MDEKLASNPDSDQLLCRLVVDQGLAAQRDLDDCLEFYRHVEASEGRRPPLGQFLVSQNLLTPRQMERLTKQLDEQKGNQIPGYQLQAKLGSGANATVYKARQLSLDRVVAIKVLPKKSSQSDDFVQRFFAEGRAAAKLNHPNIVGALDVGRTGEFAYFVMEYVEGRSVYDELLDNIRFDEEEAVKIMLDVARGLEHAHNAGLIHRDIKPQNIVLTKDGVAKIADMGLAREATSEEEVQPDTDAEADPQSTRKVNVAVGSPNYMSPEQIRNRPDLDFRADIYSFGASFYFMVTGQVPFDAPTAIGVLKKHLREPLILPDKINPRLSREITQVIQCCMQKSPGDRYDSTSDLVADLEALANGEAPLKAQLKLDPSSVLGADDTNDLVALTAKSSSGHTRINLDELEDAPILAGHTAERPAPHLGPSESAWSQAMIWIAIAGWSVALIIALLWIIL